MNRRRLLLVLGLIAAGAIIWRARPSAPVTPQPAGERPPASPIAGYVGADACASCHRDAYTAWRTSQHRDAMQPVSAASVKGRFDGGRFRYDNVVSEFFQRDGGYRVRTDGADGTPADFEIKYTFGVSPLQQYLIQLPQGRVQALSIAWDTRPKSGGGQRWFHLYPGQHVVHGDELHWTQRQQNWNFMCADCHSTNLRKNYDAASDSFRTTWSEISVGCEACHGPASRHVSWAQQPPASSGARPADNGLTVHLTERRDVVWRMDPASMKPARSSPRSTSWEIDTCAPCHSRRSQIADGYYAGAPLQDYYEPATLEPSLYYPDGQQRDEVYTYGSFLQSRMAHAGVTCSDCHDPHAATLRASGNALCTRCHAPARYDGPDHHRHQSGSAGAMCVECHMPARTYMQIDSRRDHSLRVPRPDLTPATGAPNACTSCHTTRPDAWAASAIRQWLGRDAAGFQNFAQALHDFDQRRPGAVDSLIRLGSSPAEPAIVRASAWERLAAADFPVAAASAALRASDPLERRSALRALDRAAAADRAAVASPLLSDPIRSVRIAAARAMAGAANRLSVSDRAAFDRAADELIAAARFNADRPESRVSLGVFFADLGRASEAAAEYRSAIRLGPDFAPGYVNLAELLRTTASEADADRVLRDGLARNPAAAELHYALGLSLTRAHRSAEAAAELKKAMDLAPSAAQYAYAYALALHGAGQPAAAIRLLTSTLAAHPDDRDVLFALATLERDAGRLAAARQHAARLVAAYPNDQEARALLESLREPRR